MIDFSGYTKAAIQKDMLSQVDDTLDKREGSIIYTATAPVAWHLEGDYLTLDQVQKNAFPTTAVGESLELLAASRGLTRKAATAAVRVGTFDAEIAEGSAFRTINAGDSVVFVSGDLIDNSNDVYHYHLTCQTAGTIGNAYTGAILPVTAIVGLTSASIGEITTEGTDTETDEELLARYLATFDTEPFGGNISAYRQAILALDGVAAVQVYPAYNGGGTVLCSILGSGLVPASQTLIDTVQAYICPPEDGETTPSASGYGYAPIGAAVTITTAENLRLNITMTVTWVTGVSDGVASYQTDIEEAISAYIDSVCETWGDALVSQTVSYSMTVYVSRIIAAVLNAVTAVENVSDVTINGESGDLTLTENAALQQIPSLGSVTINE